MTGETVNEGLYRTLVEESPEAMYIVRDGRFVYLNASAIRLFGASSAESLLGTDVLERVHPDDHALALARRKRVLESGLKAPLAEMRFLSLDGRIFEVEVQANPIDFGGPATYAAARDITSRRALEDQVRQAQKLEAVGRLAGGIAHDFNNTLAVILGHAEFALQATGESEALSEDLRAIQRAAQHSAVLTRQLLTYARRQTIAPRALDLNDSITEALRMLKPLIGESISLRWSPASDLWPVTLDPAQLDQILTNLCANARDAIGGHGTLSITTENCTVSVEASRDIPNSLPGEYVLLRVRDDGHGMTPDVRAQIFEPFFTTKGLGEGTGLGLAMVYGIVRQNHGAITVTSAPQQGTEMSLYFPRFVGAIESVASSEPPTSAAPGSETILVVEDEPEVLRVVQRTLESRGYEVLAASSPVEALALSDAHPRRIDLLVSDVMMPGMNGPDLARRLATTRTDMRIIFMSGFTADLITQQNRLDTQTNFLSKPFTIGELTGLVRNVLDGGAVHSA